MAGVELSHVSYISILPFIMKFQKENLRTGKFTGSEIYGLVICLTVFLIAEVSRCRLMLSFRPAFGFCSGFRSITVSIALHNWLKVWITSVFLPPSRISLVKVCISSILLGNTVSLEEISFSSFRISSFNEFLPLLLFSCIFVLHVVSISGKQNYFIPHG